MLALKKMYWWKHQVGGLLESVGISAVDCKGTLATLSFVLEDTSGLLNWCIPKRLT